MLGWGRCVGLRPLDGLVRAPPRFTCSCARISALTGVAEAKYGTPMVLPLRRRKVSREVMALEYMDRTRLWVENTQARLRNEHVRACGWMGSSLVLMPCCPRGCFPRHPKPSLLSVRSVDVGSD